MPIFSKPSSVARTTVIYVTVGALTVVWSGIWFWYLRNSSPSTDATFYWCYGFMITGVTLVIIGLIIGRIGWLGGDAHQADLHHAELHRTELHREQLHREDISHAVSQAEMIAAAKAPTIATVRPAAVPVVTEGS